MLGVSGFQGLSILGFGVYSFTVLGFIGLGFRVCKSRVLGRKDFRSRV